MSQNFRISQRLQWAAGANSALNSVLDEFQRATNRRAQALSVSMAEMNVKFSIGII